jgi:hypothetical protein
VNTDGMTHAQVEAKGVEWAVELLSTWLSPGATLTDTRTCASREFMQRTCGDFIGTLSDGITRNIEVKAERRHTGNLFIETWSNRCVETELRRDGWIFTLHANWFLYVFLDREVTYLMDFPKLKEWCQIEGNMYRYPEKPAAASLDGTQRNMSIGHPVPIAAMREPVGIRAYHRTAAGLWAPLRCQEAGL